MTPLYERLARAGLAVTARHEFALGGCHALRAHDLADRPCADVELFTPHPDGVAAAVPVVAAAYRDLGLDATVELAGGSFARLRVRARDGSAAKVKLCVDDRRRPPVRLDIGPVLSADDAVAGAMIALLGRRLAEDFLDVDLVLADGRYRRGDLLRLARRHDREFAAAYFCEALAALRFIPDLAFAPYGLTGAETGALRARYAGWQRELIIAWLSRG